MYTYKMSRITTKPVLGVSDTNQTVQMVICSELGSRGMVLSMYENKGAVSCEVIAQLIRAFFAYAKSRFSHDAAQISELKQILYQPIIILISFKPKPETFEPRREKTNILVSDLV